MELIVPLLAVFLPAALAGFAMADALKTRRRVARLETEIRKREKRLLASIDRVEKLAADLECL